MSQAFTMHGSLQIVPRLVDGLTTLTANAGRQLALSTGVSAGQATGYHTQTLSIAAGESATIDLRSLPVSLPMFGASGAVGMASVKTLLVLNLSDATGITVAPGATNGWDNIGTTPLGGAGTLLIHSPVSGVATSTNSKTVKFTNTDTVYALTGNTKAGSSTVSGLSSTAGLEAGMIVTASSEVPLGATIAAVVDGATITLSENAWGEDTVAFTFQRPPAFVEIHVVGVRA